MDKIHSILQAQFNGHVQLRERKPEVFQFVGPLYHEDGDMVDIFLIRQEDGTVKVTDLGKTLMRLSYSYEIDTPRKTQIFEKIIAENRLNQQEGEIYLISPVEHLFETIMNLYGVIGKVTNLSLFKREVVRGMFFEMLDAFIMSELASFNPVKNYLPIEGHDEYTVDYYFNSRPRPIYLFGVNDVSKARLATISCLKFLNENFRFRSVIVFDDLESVGKKDMARLMSAGDKQFPSLDDFRANAQQFLERERD